jgi:hypothetical protein
MKEMDEMNESFDLDKYVMPSLDRCIRWVLLTPLAGISLIQNLQIATSGRCYLVLS